VKMVAVVAGEETASIQCGVRTRNGGAGDKCICAGIRFLSCGDVRCRVARKPRWWTSSPRKLARRNWWNLGADRTRLPATIRRHLVDRGKLGGVRDTGVIPHGFERLRWRASAEKKACHLMGVVNPPKLTPLLVGS